MLSTRVKATTLSLISVLSFGCSANNGVTLPVSNIVQEDGTNFSTKAGEATNVKPSQPPIGEKQGQQKNGNGQQKPPAPPTDGKEGCNKDGGNMAPPPPPSMDGTQQGQPKPPAPPQPKGSNSPQPQPSSGSGAELPKFTVSITGGYETNPVDHGRPVVLIASALGVPTEVFRSAFSLVTPAAGGQEPDPVQVDLNKKALLSVLGTYGITNDFLDTVSNYYRYNGSAGEVWKRTPATATAIVTDGVVTGIRIDNPGAGYSSEPTVTISGVTGVTAKATLSFTKDFATNGSISAITLNK